MWPCVQLLCAECNAPCQRDLAIDKAKIPASAAKWQGNDQTDLQCQTTRHCHHQVQWATCGAWHWGSGSHSEGEKTPMIWACGTLQWCCQDSFWHTGWWKSWAWDAQDDMETADRGGLQSGSSRPSTVMIDIQYLEIWCEISHACSKPAIWKGGHWCGCCPCTCMLIKNPIVMMIPHVFVQNSEKKSLIFSWKVCLIWSYVTALFRVLKDFSTNLSSP